MRRPKIPVPIPNFLRARERGQLMILSAILLPVLMGFTALAVDLGYLYVSRTSEQRAADAAALAGALARLNGSTEAQAIDVAKDYATKNGYDASAKNADGSDVVRAYWIPEPPSKFCCDEDPTSLTWNQKYIEVKILKTQPTFFIRALSALVGIEAPTSVNVFARGVAKVDPIVKQYALIVLNPHLCGAYTHTSSNDITIVDGGAVVNSDGTVGCGTPPCSACQSGGNTVTANADGTCPTDGGCTLDHYSAGDWYTCSNCTASPPPTPIAAPVLDPLRCRVDLYGSSIDLWGSNKPSVNGIPTADPGWKPPGGDPFGPDCVAPPIPCPDTPVAPLAFPTYCNVSTSPDTGGTAKMPKQLNLAGNTLVTLRPGVYWGGISITGSGDVRFDPGIYVFAGGGGALQNAGGFSYASASANVCPIVACPGVTFFNTSDPYANTANDRKCGAFKLAGGGSLNLNAPKIPPYPVLTWPSPPADISPSTNGWKNMLFWQSTTCNAQMPFDYGGSGSGGAWVTSGVIYMPKAQLNVNGAAAFGSVQIVADTFNFGGAKDVVIQYEPFIVTQAPQVKLVE